MFQEIFSRPRHDLTAVPTFTGCCSARSSHADAHPHFHQRFRSIPMQTLKEFEEKFKVPLIEGYA